jgi:hypothetical protein
MITLTREEAQQVLDALNSCDETWVYDGEDEQIVDQYDHKLVAKAKELFNAKIAQPEPKDDGDCQVCEENQCTGKTGCVALSNPPQRVYCSCGDGIVADDGALCGTCVSLKEKREWQGLTDEERTYLAWESNNGPHCVAMTEAKLKE